MKKKFIFNHCVVLAVFALIFAACEPEFSDVGSDILADPNYTSNSVEFPVTTYNQSLNPIQSNIQDDKLFGYHQDPVFGNFTSNVVTQVTPVSLDPAFGDNVVLDSVVLTIPYYFNIVDFDEDNNNIYELDSVFGSEPLALKIWRNNYFLRTFDPNEDINVSEQYFSDRSTSSGEQLMLSDLEQTLLYQDDEFVFSADPIILTEQEFDEEGEPVLDEDGNAIFNETGRQAPSLRVRLDANIQSPTPVIPPNFWQELIFDKEGEPELSNENNFLNYFRGIYLSAESVSGNGSMALLNLGSSNANITIYYTSETEGDPDIPDSEDTIEEGTYVLNLTGNRLNFIENELIDFPVGDPINGDSQLYLKGVQGNMAVINLFDENDTTLWDDLEDESIETYTQFKEAVKDSWLINEARLTFYVDQDAVQGQEPDRVYLMDLENNIFLRDWEADQSAGLIPELAKTDHLPPLFREGDEPDGNGIKYRVEVTEHIKSLIRLDSTNVKLGLYVTSNTLSVQNIRLKDQDGLVQNTNTGSLVYPRGTILHGNQSPMPLKRPKLEIFYTEPEN